MAFLKALSNLGSELVRVAFTSPCVVCDDELAVRRRVSSCCVDCWSGLPRLDERRCASCALPLPAASGRRDTRCLRCLTEPLDTSWIDSWGRYESGLTKVLQAFKFGGQAFLAGPLSDLLLSVLHARRPESLDLVVPVPMGKAKERRRGYNQAALLAASLSRKAGLPVDGAALRKPTDRRTQSELKKDERRANVRGTFVAERRIAGARILLVDDICTTGETLSACAAALRDAGASEVMGVTVARTP